jgi:sugar phosphate isomerase/epimerase
MKIYSILIRSGYSAIFILIFLFTCNIKDQTTDLKVSQNEINNSFFAFNNSFLNLQPISEEDQVRILENLGYDGIEHREVENIREMITALKKHNLKMFTSYIKIDIDNIENPYHPDLVAAFPELKDTGIILWLHIHSEKFQSSDVKADEQIVPILQNLADEAVKYNIRLAIYPHTSFLAEKAEDSYRIAKKVDRENVGAVFNLCHFLKTDDENNLGNIARQLLPKLFVISISGADSGDTNSMDWDRLIQPLGMGTFDVYAVVKLFADLGYTGPVGLQCYNIPGNPQDFLAISIRTWMDFNDQYRNKLNTLSEDEINDGWELLFDGHTTENWRGMFNNNMPAGGWVVKANALCANMDNDTTSKGGGDIITKRQFGDFDLKWDWRLMTKGGNSGLKYYLKEYDEKQNRYGLGLEYQLLDDNNFEWMSDGSMKPNDYHSLGGLYELYPPSESKKIMPLGSWNSSRIISVHNHVEHWLNGIKILEYKRGSLDFKKRIAASKFRDAKGFGLFEEGYIMLQDHGGAIQFRNIKIRELN